MVHCRSPNYRLKFLKIATILTQQDVSLFIYHVSLLNKKKKKKVVFLHQLELQNNALCVHIEIVYQVLLHTDQTCPHFYGMVSCHNYPLRCPVVEDKI